MNNPSPPTPLPQGPRRARRKPRRPARGFSLIEVMVVLVVMGVLIGLSVPSYRRALEQSRADLAAANLRAIWSAERLYWIESRTYAADVVQLRSVGLLDAEMVLSTTGYAYAIVAADDNTFEAAATRIGSTHWSGAYTIDQTGLLGGALRAAGESDIVPGFQ